MSIDRIDQLDIPVSQLDTAAIGRTPDKTGHLF